MGSENDLFQRAVIAFSDEDFERAEQLIKDLLKLDSNNVDGWSLLANIHQQQGENEQAIQAATKATELEPDSLQNWNNLGYLHLLQGNWTEGERCYTKASTLSDPTPTIFLNLAWALIEQGKQDLAKEQLSKALERSLEDTLYDDLETNEQYAKLRPLFKRLKK